MLIYAARRMLGALPALFVVLGLTFFLIRLAPGGPFDGDRVWPPEIQRNLDRKYGLDRPVHVQFGMWVSDLTRGDLRESFYHRGTPVRDLIADTFPLSLRLGGIALAIALLVGIPLGGIAAWKRNTWIDFSAMFTAIAGVTLPSYLTASVLVLVFAVWLEWLPPALYEGPESLILPIFTLALRPMAMIARLVRTSMIEASHSDYVRTAHAKGLPESRVVFKHMLKNSMIPVVTLLGPLTANLITGSFVVEVIFQIPGIGRYFVVAVLNRDYPLIMGVTLVYGVILTLANLVVDLAYGLVDPRIRMRA